MSRRNIDFDVDALALFLLGAGALALVMASRGRLAPAPAPPAPPAPAPVPTGPIQTGRRGRARESRRPRQAPSESLWQPWPSPGWIL